MILKGAFGAMMGLTMVTFMWAAPRGIGVAGSAPEPVTKGPTSVRTGSTRHTYIWLGSGGK